MKNTKNGTFATAHLFLAVFRKAFGQVYLVLLITEALKKDGWVLKYAFSVFVVKLYSFCLSTAYIARRRHFGLRQGGGRIFVALLYFTMKKCPQDIAHQYIRPVLLAAMKFWIASGDVLFKFTSTVRMSRGNG